MRSDLKQEKINKEIFYDAIFLNPDFEALFQALQQLQQKKRILLIFETGLNRDDRFITTRTFPFCFSELPHLVNELKVWNKIMLEIPHLFQLQKVIYLGLNKSGYLKSVIADTFFKNEYQKKSFKLQDFNQSEFSFFKASPGKAIVFQEYRFNVARFFIEILKYFKSEGGEIVLSQIDKTGEQNFRIKNASTKATGRYFSSGPQFKTVLKIPVQPYKNFDAIVKRSNSFFRFSEFEMNIIAEAIYPSEKNVSKSELINIASDYFSFKKNEVVFKHIPVTPTVKEIAVFLPKIHSVLPCSYQVKNIESNYEMCLEKYDLAKQTGISYSDFKILFHRYGAAIDEITESAYEKLNEMKETDKIWEAAEKEYRQNHEWLKPKD